ncbi:hypothetical protein LOC09_09325 [Lactobacillus delbrueckii subsp. lactis]|uniref:hypothetical protein n=1 Tax=Lactobacillus delbrueckii TaxID=1584 RepID=UPI001E30EEC2|nr:hypothetical protein [Lactobacillus delbrueckii]MCD5516740.1 hypothetical protein [Lactobacillus delbrueckii subsp. lactis]MCD5522543.1 hypothetical protein [Lactobacillus delbrueckii subsp. lactis]
MTPNLTAFTGVDSQNLPDVMVSVQFILAIGVLKSLHYFNNISNKLLFSLDKAVAIKAGVRERKRKAAELNQRLY